MSAESQIVPTFAEKGVTIKRNVKFAELLGRKVASFSSCCGTYDHGGPGFIGFELEADSVNPKEWLILCLWGAGQWLTVNGRWLEAHPIQYNIQNPMMSNFPNAKWDEFSPLVVGLFVDWFDVGKKSCEINIGNAHIVLSQNPNDRPFYTGIGKSRRLSKSDDLRKAWIIASAPWVQI